MLYVNNILAVLCVSLLALQPLINLKFFDIDLYSPVLFGLSNTCTFLALAVRPSMPHPWIQHWIHILPQGSFLPILVFLAIRVFEKPRQQKDVKYKYNTIASVMALHDVFGLTIIRCLRSIFNYALEFNGQYKLIMFVAHNNGQYEFILPADLFLKVNWQDRWSPTRICGRHIFPWSDLHVSLNTSMRPHRRLLLSAEPMYRRARWRPGIYHWFQYRLYVLSKKSEIWL